MISISEVGLFLFSLYYLSSMIASPVLRSKAFVEKVLQNFKAQGGYDAHVLSKLCLVDSDASRVVAELTVEKYHLNRLGTVHGGLLATVVDIGGSLAIASRGLFATGVSTDINISYLSSATQGDVLTMVAKCDRLGKTLAFTSVDIKCKDTLVAIGRHNKWVAKAHSHPLNRTEQGEAVEAVEDASTVPIKQSNQKS
ncbi:HotDog domain-containing protein [Spinellus fusiger]|nr:HotDog domain-containing protein [Spinellus fusiger]